MNISQYRQLIINEIEKLTDEKTLKLIYELIKRLRD